MLMIDYLSFDHVRKSRKNIMMDYIVFLGTVQTSSITTALTPKIGLGKNHVCTRGLSAIEILIFWYWDHAFEIIIWPNLQMDF